MSHVACRTCGSKNLRIERRPDGDIICDNGHKHKNEIPMTSHALAISELQKLVNQLNNAVTQEEKIAVTNQIQDHMVAELQKLIEKTV